MVTVVHLSVSFFLEACEEALTQLVGHGASVSDTENYYLFLCQLFMMAARFLPPIVNNVGGAKKVEVRKVDDETLASILREREDIFNPVSPVLESLESFGNACAVSDMMYDTLSGRENPMGLTMMASSPMNENLLSAANLRKEAKCDALKHYHDIKSPRPFRIPSFLDTKMLKPNTSQMPSRSPTPSRMFESAAEKKQVATVGGKKSPPVVVERVRRAKTIDAAELRRGKPLQPRSVNTAARR